MLAAITESGAAEVLFIIAAILAVIASVIPETRAPRFHIGWLAVAAIAGGLLCS